MVGYGQLWDARRVTTRTLAFGTADDRAARQVTGLLIYPGAY